MASNSKRKRELASRPTVAILVPCYKCPDPRMQMALGEMLRYTHEHAANVFCPPIVQTSVVHWTRNYLIAQLIKSQQPFTHVLFLDDDIVPQADYLAKLLAHGKDIVGALCTRRQDPPIPNARVFNKDTGVFCELWQWPEGLVEVGAIGTGMLLISREALQKVADAYFQCRYEIREGGMSEEKAKAVSEQRVSDFDADANGWWFRFLPKTNYSGEYGEDISFCLIAKQYCDIPVYVDTTLLPEHMGAYGFSIADFLPHREQAMAQARAEGRYINPPSLKAETSPDSEIIQLVS